MFEIHLKNTSKRYTHEWIFRNLNYQFIAGNAYAVIGPNGSGKSTLLQVASGFIPVNKGTVFFKANNQVIEEDLIPEQIAIAAPYVELIEEFTLLEFLQFHFQFKKIMKGYDIKKIINELGLHQAKDKYLKNFSSGMKQRVKLATCFYSDVPVVMLDEPTTNLDSLGVEWYQYSVLKLSKNKLVIICSNDAKEYEFCNQELNIMEYKKLK
jgi:ABC-type multidrug transport system ATPase subunit